jgi:leucyl aminopeptidase
MQASFITSFVFRNNVLVLLMMAIVAWGADSSAKPVIADMELLKAAEVDLLSTDDALGLGYANLTLDQELRLSKLAHARGRCGGFEALPFGPVDSKHPLIADVFGELKSQNERNQRFHPNSQDFIEIGRKTEIIDALDKVNADRIHDTVKFLSAFPDRDYNSAVPNKHIEATKTRLTAMIGKSKLPATVDLVTHKGIRQKSIRVRVTGSVRPHETIVLGGHLDSINQENGLDGEAPGADDNASGSAAIIEALRVVLLQGRPQRTIEFFLYAGEEGGLLGSGEIAAAYKKNKVDVVAVLQLDMIMHPGSGVLTISSITDYTSSWLRSYLETINALYLKAKIVNDECGYACSDHASWYRQGYPTVVPFESRVRDMNTKLHTSRDVIDQKSSFVHAAVFAKIAVIMAMDLGNSTLRAPK